MTSIVWTTLPLSFDPAAGIATVSVFVTPKMSGTTLDFPMTSWPDMVAKMGFQVLISDLTNAPPVAVTAKLQNKVLDSALWAQVFPPTMGVKPFAFQDNGQRHVWSYPVDVVHDAIEGAYASVAQASPTAIPALDLNAVTPLTTLIKAFDQANKERVQARGALGNVTNWDQRNAQETAMLNGTAPKSDWSPTALQKAVWMAKRFYDRPTPAKDAHQNLTGISSVAKPTFDFHERLAILADHPAIMRRLGIVLDLEFAFSGRVPQGFVQVLPKWDFHAQYDVTPRTAYEVKGARFSARPNGPGADVNEGMLPIEDTTRFYAVQGDPDGEMHKTVDFASNMVHWSGFLATQAAQAGQVAQPTNEGLPARRNFGVTITRKNRSVALQARFTATQQLHAAFEARTAVDLYADDVTRGYRVDVQSPAGKWASLHQRKASYAINGAPIGEVADDEGYVKSASATSDSDPNGPKDMYVHEALFGWHGWSLSVERPGRRIMPTPGDIADPSNPPDPSFPIASNVGLKQGSLPSMRFGAAYSFRARMVDLAGNSLGLHDDALIDPAHATAPLTLTRHEPLPPPVLVYPAGITEGESLEHLVIRSNETMDPTAYSNWLNVKWGDPAHEKMYEPNCDRHVVAPKESQIFAEMHGDFDGSFFTGADRTAFYRLGTREEGTFLDTRIASLSVDNGYIDGNPNQAIIVTPPQCPLDQRRTAPAGVGSLLANRGDPMAPGEYVVCKAPFVTTPYLPDSMVAGAAFWDPNAAGTTNVWSLDFASAAKWPDYPAFRVSLVGGSGPAGFGVSGSTAVAKLPPATILTLKYASTPRADRLKHMQYVRDYAGAADVTTGRHWMMTPPRTLTLVHAVPRPLAPPVGHLKPSRTYNETVFHHSGVITSHSNSTGHVDMTASWVESIDDPTTPGPTYPTQTGLAYTVTVAYGHDDTGLKTEKHEFGDTKHRNVLYTPVATTRYKEYFPAELIKDTKNITLAGNADYQAQNPKFNVPSTVRPHAPKIAYVVPTFKWESTGGQSIRHGGGLRVYMERPWYTSGEGEIVGVIVGTALGAVTPDALQFTSRWGRDPVWDAKPNGVLTATAFKNALGPAVALQLQEVAQTALVLPFAVEYHAGRKLWFCDLEMDPGQTYFPFVSLALVRYQPDSLGGVEISQVTRAEYAQLVPDRTLSTVSTRTGLTVSVSGPVAENLFGPKLPAPPAVIQLPGYVPAPRSHKVIASVQQRSAGSFGEMGWTTLGSSVSLVGSMPLGGGTAKWTGTVPVPAATTGAERRLLVEEYETYQADPPPPTGIPLPVPINAPPPNVDRLVYVDTMPLASGLVRLG